MKNKLNILIPLFGITLISCGGGHPLVGKTFKLSKDAPIEKYADGYTKDSYFALLGGVNNKVSSLDKLNSLVTTFFGEGFIKITDTAYESVYMTYNTTDEKTLFAIMAPSDDKGIDTECLNMTSSEGVPLVLVSASNSFGTDYTAFQINANTFKKAEDKYQATFISNYSPDNTGSNKITAYFTYTFIE